MAEAASELNGRLGVELRRAAVSTSGMDLRTLVEGSVLHFHVRQWMLSQTIVVQNNNPLLPHRVSRFHS
jgi:hypothetical protein